MKTLTLSAGNNLQQKQSKSVQSSEEQLNICHACLIQDMEECHKISVQVSCV